jgi:hypothetical protein
MFIADSSSTVKKARRYGSSSAAAGVQLNLRSVRRCKIRSTAEVKSGCRYTARLGAIQGSRFPVDIADAGATQLRIRVVPAHAALRDQE